MHVVCTTQLDTYVIYVRENDKGTWNIRRHVCAWRQTWSKFCRPEEVWATHHWKRNEAVRASGCRMSDVGLGLMHQDRLQAAFKSLKSPDGRIELTLCSKIAGAFCKACVTITMNSDLLLHSTIIQEYHLCGDAMWRSCSVEVGLKHCNVESRSYLPWGEKHAWSRVG